MPTSKNQFQFSIIPRSTAPFQEFEIHSQRGRVGFLTSKVYVSYQAGCRPLVHHKGALYANNAQVSRLLSGLIGREVFIVSWHSESGQEEVVGVVKFKGEKYS